MSALWNWLTKKLPDDDQLDKHWNEFDKSYEGILAKTLEKNPEYINTAYFRAPLTKFLDLLHKEVSEPPKENSIGPCFTRAFSKDYFSTLNKPVGMFRLVVTKLTHLLSSSKNHAPFTNMSFVNAVSSLLSYSLKCVLSDYLIPEQVLVLKLLIAFSPIVAKSEAVIKGLFQEVPGKQALEFLPLRLTREMLLKEQFLGNELFSVFTAYTAINSSMLQSYIVSEPDISLSIAKAFSMILLKLPSKVQLVYDLLNPHLKYSLSFQLFNMTNNKRAYSELKVLTGFINTLFATVANNAFLDQVLKGFFNLVLVSILQPRIVLGFKTKPAAARTTLQYLILLLENTTSKDLAKLIFHFLFGFSGKLPYRAIKVDMSSPKPVEVEDTSVEITSGELSVKSLTALSATKEPKELDTSICSVNNILEDEEDSKSVLAVKNLKEDRKERTLTQQGERREQTHTIESPILPEAINVNEYDLERHSPGIISTFVLDLIVYEHGGYSNIALQLIDKLLSFSIKEVYGAFIFSSINPLHSYCRKVTSEILQLFPYYHGILKNLRPTQKQLDKAYHGLSVVLSDDSCDRLEVFEGDSKSRSVPGAFNFTEFMTSNTSPMQRKSCSPVSKAQSVSKGYSPGRTESGLSPVKIAPNETVFLEILLKKLERMLVNSFDENLFLSSIILKLFSVPYTHCEPHSLSLHDFLLSIDDNSLFGVMKKLASEIIQNVETIPKFPEILKRRREIHKRVALNMIIPAWHDEAKVERFVDATIVFEELLKEIVEILYVNEEVSGLLESARNSLEEFKK